ncbi:MAG: glycosyltransferase family 2 protein [Oscillospiraceae bacterium]|nr:glycosyltransferase family 2 protein [Oscillospiraceae bacterium]
MKSNVKKSDNSVILSIGMIVKNEENVLERCLESLKPLMNSVSSELVIADTGSTDHTVKIARRYTDKVFCIEWTGDFSKARNYTINKSSGKWYMFIDADEYLDQNIDELVSFFYNKELMDKYVALELLFRNYFNIEKSNYSDSYLPRIFKMYDGIKFIGEIHENIIIKGKSAYSSVMIHHTGYCHLSPTQENIKRKRNIPPLLKEYEKDPTNLRTLSLLLTECFDDIDKMEKFIPEALKLLKTNRGHYCGNVIFMQAIAYFRNYNPDYALKLCDEYYIGNNDYEDCVTTVSIVSLKALILSDIGRFGEAYEEFLKYLEFFKKYQNNQLKIDDLFNRPLIGLSDREYYKNYYTAVMCLIRIFRYNEAEEMLSQIQINEISGNEYRGFISLLREISSKRNDYKLVAHYYDVINQSGSPEKKNLALYMLESLYFSLVGEKRLKFVKDISSSGVNGKYIELMNLLVSQEEAGFKEKLISFINSIEDWSEGYSVAVYLAVKHKLDISDIIEKKMVPSDFRSKLEEIAKSDDDFAGYVLEYGCPEGYFSGIKQFYWLVSLYEKASYRSFLLSDDKKYELYSKFVNLLGDYIMNIYNPELLNDDDVDVLIPLHKFGYFMYKANNSLLNGDKVGYIRNMKKALSHCESMKEIVEFLLGWFRKNNI